MFCFLLCVLPCFCIRYLLHAEICHPFYLNNYNRLLDVREKRTGNINETEYLCFNLFPNDKNRYE